jgi:hypothetical protein
MSAGRSPARAYAAAAASPAEKQSSVMSGGGYSGPEPSPPASTATAAEQVAHQKAGRRAMCSVLCCAAALKPCHQPQLPQLQEWRHPTAMVCLIRCSFEMARRSLHLLFKPALQTPYPCCCRVHAVTSRAPAASMLRQQHTAPCFNGICCPPPPSTANTYLCCCCLRVVTPQAPAAGMLRHQPAWRTPAWWSLEPQAPTPAPPDVLHA